MAELIDGVKIKMGGREWEVPALSFKQVRRLAPQIDALSSLSTSTISEEQMAGICTIVHAALSRNYPEVTLDQVEDFMDLRNAGPTILAVMGQSGFEAKSGEATAGSR